MPSSFDQAPVIQRAAAKPAAPKAAQSKSGRDPATLWNLFAQYSGDMATAVTTAFSKAGYTMDSMRAEILKAIKTKRLDLPAHGSGAAGSGVQGNFEAEARNWVTVLVAWAAANPAGGGGGGGGGAASGLRHTPDQERKHRQEKLEAKLAADKGKKKTYCEENGHDYRSYGASRVCSNCGDYVE